MVNNMYFHTLFVFVVIPEGCSKNIQPRVNHSKICTAAVTKNKMAKQPSAVIQNHTSLLKGNKRPTNGATKAHPESTISNETARRYVTPTPFPKSDVDPVDIGKRRLET